MTIREYIERKNAIIERHTGLVLVPKDQIIDMEPVGELSIETDTFACPYCLKWSIGFSCGDCPMYIKNNRCGYSYSTYQRITEKCGAIVNKKNPWYEELSELIVQYNKELPKEERVKQW